MSNRLHCSVCGNFVLIDAHTVSCRKCRITGTFAATILTLLAQAEEAGKTLDVESIRANDQGELTFSFRTLKRMKASRKAAS